jgi:hypothetical protein
LPVGDFSLSNGEVIYVRYRVMPFALKEESRRGATYFFKGGRALHWHRTKGFVRSCIAWARCKIECC